MTKKLKEIVMEKSGLTKFTSVVGYSQTGCDDKETNVNHD